MDVTIRCTCPPTADGEPRHAQDTVVLHEPLLSSVRHAVLYDVSLMPDDSTGGDQMAVMTNGLVLRSVDRWTLEDEITDDKGKVKIGPLPPSRLNIQRRLLDVYDIGDVLVKAADDLYTEAVMRPLMLGASTSSPPTSTTSSTSATNGQASPKKPSKRSSTSTIPMVVTGPMQSSPVGVSSS